MSDIIKTQVKAADMSAGTGKNGRSQLRIIAILALCLVVAVVLLCVTGVKFRSAQKSFQNRIEAQDREIQSLKDANYVLSQTISQQQKQMQELENKRSENLFEYTVKAGDTLGAICRDYSINYKNNVEYILKLNDIKDPNVLSIGQLILLPRSW